jgi:regulatory protein
MKLEIDHSNPEQALARIVRLVDVRDRSVKEMRERLGREGYDEQVVDEALERAVNCGLLDDERFAKSYCRGKLRSGWGAERIRCELRRFGIEPDEFEYMLTEFSDEQDQVSRAVTALHRHRSHAKNQREAAYRFLLAKGYATSVIQSALARCDTNLQ